MKSSSPFFANGPGCHCQSSQVCPFSAHQCREPHELRTQSHGIAVYNLKARLRSRPDNGVIVCLRARGTGDNHCPRAQADQAFGVVRSHLFQQRESGVELLSIPDFPISDARCVRICFCPTSTSKVLGSRPTYRAASSLFKPRGWIPPSIFVTLDRGGGAGPVTPKYCR